MLHTVRPTPEVETKLNCCVSEAPRRVFDKSSQQDLDIYMYMYIYSLVKKIVLTAGGGGSIMISDVDDDDLTMHTCIIWHCFSILCRVRLLSRVTPVVYRRRP